MNKDNVLIAEFMNLESELLAKGLFQKKYKHSFSSHGFSDWVSEEMLEFHSSWNWLMPVIEKIESFKHPVYISSNNCQIYEKISWGEHNGWHTDCYGKNKLEAIFLAVIEFIKWYNQNKLNETN